MGLSVPGVQGAFNPGLPQASFRWEACGQQVFLEVGRWTWVSSFPKNLGFSHLASVSAFPDTQGSPDLPLTS